MQIFYITDNVPLLMLCFLKFTPQNNQKMNLQIEKRYYATFLKFHLVPL